MDITEVLPKECMSTIICFTCPEDACRSSVVSSDFKAIADSDDVWKQFLPSECGHIVSNSSSPQLNSLSKKELFLHLCDHPILLPDHNMSFSLEKESGKKCYMIGAKGLAISWGENSSYWVWNTNPNSRFPQVAELYSVWWLEVKGRIDTKLLSPKTTYGVFLVYKFRLYGPCGFDERPMKLSVNFEGSKNGSHKRVFLDRPSKFIHSRGNGWVEVEMGEFFNGYGENGSVVCRLFEKEALKGGIIIEGIEFRPKQPRIKKNSKEFR